MMSKTSQIAKYLRERYCLPKYALFFEVPDKIGNDSSRRADAIAVCLESDKTNIIGFEIKVSRSDWLRELKQPEKSYCFAKQCNQFYIVAPQDIIQIDELPDDYGWIIPFYSRTKKYAVKKEIEPSVDLMKVLLRTTALKNEKYEKIQRIVEDSLYDFIEKEINE